MENEKMICAECGEVIEGSNYYTTASGETICEDCYESEYFTCDDCGEIFPWDECIYIDGRWKSRYICESCADDNHYYCEVCGEYHESTEEVLYTGLLHNGRYAQYENTYLCSGCRSDLNHCEACDVYCPDNEYDFEVGLCESCAENAGADVIGEYHSNNGWTDFGDEDLFGIELEVESLGSASKFDIAKRLSENYLGEHAIFQRDSSLERGFEIITQPHSIDRFNEIDWRGALKFLTDEGVRSHDTTTCGLHIHVTRDFFGDTLEEYYTNTAKVVYLYSMRWNFFLKLSRRTQEQADRWAAVHESKNLEEAKECVKGSSRYHAINFRNRDTVEFRLGRGTLRYESFMAWIDLHLTMSRNVKQVDENNPLDLSVWLKGISQSTLDYIRERHAFDAIGIEEPKIEVREEK